MADLVVGLIVLVLAGAAVAYIIQSRKKGIKCIGCPEGLNCPHSGKSSGCGSCGGCGGNGGNETNG